MIFMVWQLVVFAFCHKESFVIVPLRVLGLAFTTKHVLKNKKFAVFSSICIQKLDTIYVNLIQLRNLTA